MKNNIFKKLLLLTVLLLFSVNIKALTARVPSVVPSEGDSLYAAVDTDFDFSRISFTTLPTTGTDIVGKTDMKKIMLARTFNASGLDNDWFSAYCLDGKKKFPIYGYASRTFNNDQERMDAAVQFALFNRSNVTGLMSNLFLTASGYEIVVVNYINPSAGDLALFLADTAITVDVTSVVYTKISDPLNPLTITAAQLLTAAGQTGTNYQITVKLSDVQYDTYQTINMPDNVSYNFALWIIEHSYPTLDIQTSLADAGADYATLLTEIEALHTGTTLTTAQLEELAENYVYSTVQYAIWKAADGVDYTSGSTTYKLGNTLIGSTQLNRLYQYLTKVRGIYATYGSQEFNNTLELVSPESGNEISSENSLLVQYGPYHVTGNMLSLGDASVSIQGASGDNVKIVDMLGNQISTVRAEEEFYVSVSKSSNLTDITLRVSTDNGVIFNPTTNRGRIYYPNYVLEQNVASGGRTVLITASHDFVLNYNPKTGVQDIAMVLLITLVSFGLGYLLLRTKDKSLQF
ncbi:MAG: Cys-Gln thioester bond-forming surface protein [Tenericutes bacterium]|nr:Cys-Gln thioester bond-forming surface protein [Mycoplasmatota bacterium]